MSAVPNSSFFIGESQGLIVCWPGDEAEIVLMYDGDQVYIPGRGRAYTEQDRVRHRFLSAIDPHTGKPIPGTIMVADQWRSDPTGQNTKVIDAGKILEGMFGRAGIHRAYGLRGLRVVRSVEHVGAAMKEGRAQWEESQIDSDINTLREESARQHLWAKTGMIAPPASPDVRRADERLRRLGTRRRNPDLDMGHISETLNLVLGGAAAPAVGRVSTARSGDLPPEEPEPDEDESAADVVLNAADEAGVELTAEELRGLVARDRAVIEAVQRRVMEADTQRGA